MVIIEATVNTRLYSQVWQIHTTGCRRRSQSRTLPYLLSSIAFARLAAPLQLEVVLVVWPGMSFRLFPVSQPDFSLELTGFFPQQLQSDI